MSQVAFDERVAGELVRYARMVVARGYIHNSLGNIAVRVPHWDFPHGVAYTKHAEVSLEEMTIDNVVVTDIPTPTLLHGRVPTSVGHNLNREILRLRPDIGAVIHAHHDETIAFFAAGAKGLRVLSLEFPYVMAMPPHAPHRKMANTNNPNDWAKAPAASAIAPSPCDSSSARPWWRTSPVRSSRMIVLTRPMLLQTFMNVRSRAEPANTSRTSSGIVTM